jgi:hypothetical protein
MELVTKANSTSDEASLATLKGQLLAGGRELGILQQSPGDGEAHNSQAEFMEISAPTTRKKAVREQTRAKLGVKKKTATKRATK